MSPAKAVLQDIYPHLGTRAQNALISAYGVLYKRRRLGGRFAQLTGDFAARDRWPVERMNDYLETSLRRLLLHAWERSPFYRRTWAESGLESWMFGEFRLQDLRYLPIVAKRDLREQP